MKIKLSVKIPTTSMSSITMKVQRSYSKALKIATQRIVPLVVDRAQQMIDAASPPMAGRYKKAVAEPRAVQVDEKGVTLTITDPLVLAVEKGTKGFDMKQKLLAHAKKSSKKGGAYIDIPFKHKASEVPTKMKAAMARAAKKADNAADVRASMRTPGKAFTRQLQRGALGQALRMSPKKQQVQHKRGVHDDMHRSATKTGSRSSVSYTTIRRISANSASTSWWHPGFKAAKVLDKVLPSVKRDVAAIIRDAFATVRVG